MWGGTGSRPARMQPGAGLLLARQGRKGERGLEVSAGGP